MEIKPKLYKLIKRFITQSTKGSDVFIHNGSKWIIFVEDKKWVIELTKEGTLWYNYYFFQNIFELVDLDVVENQHYITKWVEDNVINGVKEARPMEEWVNSEKIVDKTIQNGVKKTRRNGDSMNTEAEDAIQNGVKETHSGCDLLINDKVEDTIQNGVKKTYSDKIPHEYDWSNQFTEEIDDIIQNGVKHTEKSLQIDGSCVIEDVIKEGVKHTEYGDWEDGDERLDDIIDNGIKETNMEEHHRLREVVQTVKDGVKETNPHFLEILNPINFEPVIKEMKRMNEVNIFLDKGIKEVKELPDKSGELKGYGDYYYRQGVPTKAHTKYVDDVIRDGVKETWGYEKQPQNRINEVIENGTKENPS